MFSVFIDQVSPRIHYILEELFTRRLHVELQIHTDYGAYLNDKSVYKIEYVGVKNTESHGFVIIRSDFMLENLVDPLFEPETSSFQLGEHAQSVLNHLFSVCSPSAKESDRVKRFLEEPFPCLFSNDSDLGFDIFAMAFYFLSRYEEYQDFKADQYGRFGFYNSLESKWDYDQAPHVDIAFFHFLDTLGAAALIPQSQTIASFDIDIAFRFRGRSWKRQMASAIRFPKTLFSRFAVLFGGNDPFDPEKTVFTFLQKHRVASRVFWLCSKKVKGVNRQVKRSFLPFKETIKKCETISPIGLHPSFSLHPKETWSEEKTWLESSLNKVITDSRQHFVHLVFPQTYQELIQMGIQHDWSMGYAERFGFRAGTAFDFNWFDLSTNKPTGLVVHPFCIMDVTAKNYLKLTPEAAIDVGRSLQEMVFLFGGNFTFIAHNESLSESAGWNGWTKVFDSWANNPLEKQRYKTLKN